MLNDGFFVGKKVLVFGLGILGGGVSVTNWLREHGAQVTVTDLKDRDQLSSALKKIGANGVSLHLGGHSEDDIHSNEIIVFNPDVNPRNSYYELAVRLNKQIENEATLFYQLCNHPLVSVTGTRGKTTTTAWTRHFLDSVYTAVAAGNNPDSPLFRVLRDIRRLEYQRSMGRLPKSIVVVNELPSYHLELFGKGHQPPDVAVITNLYADHLNRYHSLPVYADAKSKIFGNQTSGQNLVLNEDNEWTSYFLSKRPKAIIWKFSKRSLAPNSRGVYYNNSQLIFQTPASVSKALDIPAFVESYGEHNLDNLMASSLSAHLMGVPWAEIQNSLQSLPQVPFRQETILEYGGVRVINDTSATSPEGGVAAIKRFGCASCILIAGGTDRELDFSQWSKVVLDHLLPKNVVMLNGSATVKMVKALGVAGKQVEVVETIQDSVKKAFALAAAYPSSVILFSPGSKSFEKFRNEWDRGKKFNRAVFREVRNARRASRSL